MRLNEDWQAVSSGPTIPVTAQPQLQPHFISAAALVELRTRNRDKCVSCLAAQSILSIGRHLTDKHSRQGTESGLLRALGAVKQLTPGGPRSPSHRTADVTERKRIAKLGQ